MEPHWLGVRLQYWVNEARQSLIALETAIAASDLLALCQHAAWFTFGAVSIPLLKNGITPSSSRGLVQLGQIAPQLRDQISLFEGSAAMTVADVIALLPLCAHALKFHDPVEWGQLGDYFLRKSEWMARQNLHREALRAMWMIVSLLATVRQQGDAQMQVEAYEVAQAWLDGVGWQTQEKQAEKLQLARSLFAEVNQIATL
jgi:hypothetical protein